MKRRILFVCLGNICRSPAAEGLLMSEIKKRGVEHLVEVDSAGTYAGHAGELPDKRMRETALKRGHKLTHRSRKFRTRDFDDFDMIIVMDDRNFDDVSDLAPSPEALDKIWRMVDFNKEYDITHVPDPYYGGADGFEYVLDVLEESTSNLLDHILEQIEE